MDSGAPGWEERAQKALRPPPAKREVSSKGLCPGPGGGTVASCLPDLGLPTSLESWGYRALISQHEVSPRGRLRRAVTSSGEETWCSQLCPWPCRGQLRPCTGVKVAFIQMPRLRHQPLCGQLNLPRPTLAP